MEVPGLDEAELRAFLMAQPRVMGRSTSRGRRAKCLAKLMASLPEPLASAQSRFASGFMWTRQAGVARQSLFRCSRLCRTPSRAIAS